ncbi:MAG: BMC domain-containing protein [Desulfobacterales bacterium]|nr:BMC domain-containing protein [Desulfobacterales bacterium]
MVVDSLGIVESRSIASGAVLADAMMKAADVSLIRAQTICSGRYLIHVSGDRMAVATSVGAAQKMGLSLSGYCTLSNISTEVLEVMKHSRPVSLSGALGVVECRTVTSGIQAADASVKRSNAELARMVLASGINGKSFFVLFGDVASVEEGVSAACEKAGQKLVEAVVLPSPSPDVARAFAGRVAALRE